MSAKEICEKVRLPNEINKFQPIIVPVLSLDGNTIYFDRKNHPDNIGGINDRDDIWMAKRNENGTWLEPKNAGKPLNSEHYDVLFSITPDGKTALIYGEYTENGEKTDGFSIIKKEGTKWGKPNKLNIDNYFNESKEFYAHLSFDATKLFISLERDDGYGYLDIYVCFYDELTNTWTEPVNMGTKINTPMIETGMFLAYDNKTFYFSSSGIDNIGALDLLMVRRLDDTWTKWSEPVSLGNKVNSVYDDSSIWLTALGDTAYVTSNDTINRREGIYHVCLPDSLRPYPYAIVYGSLYLVDIEGNKTPFTEKAELRVYDKDGTEYIYETQNSDGSFIIIDHTDQIGQGPTVYNENYGYGKGYFVHDEKHTEPFWMNYDRYFEEKTKLKIDTLSMTIYFDFASDELTEESKEQLLSIIGLKNIKSIFLRGHTDHIGEVEDNLGLSNRRAIAVKNYLIGNNIDITHKTGLGFGGRTSGFVITAHGEHNPVSEISKKNRRVEILVIY